MTTIAWDGKKVAADSLMCKDDLRCGEVKKIHQVDSDFIAGCGTARDVLMFVDWYTHRNNSMGPRDYPEGDFECLVITTDGAFSMNGTCKQPVEIEPPFAMGSGKALALGAMAAGADAVKAVACAAQYDIYTGGQIWYCNTPMKEAKVQTAIFENTKPEQDHTVLIGKALEGTIVLNGTWEATCPLHSVERVPLFISRLMNGNTEVRCLRNCDGQQLKSAITHILCGVPEVAQQ